MGASRGEIAAFMTMMVLFGAVVCLRFAPAVVAQLKQDDPGEVVADEWAGQAVVFLGGVMLAGEASLAMMLAGFGLFRLFDILKPWPIRRCERLSGGVGILADDIVAGLMASVVLVISWKLGLGDFLGRHLRLSSELNIFTAVALGSVQGLTEFLPVSSDGHLVLLQWLFGFQQEESGPMLLFDLMVHVGTVASILIVMRNDIISWLRRLVQSGRYGQTIQQVYRRSAAVRILVLAVVADIVTAAVYLVFRHSLESSRGMNLMLAGGWAITGVLLVLTDQRRKSRVGLRDFGMVAAAWVGFAQAIAILPSVSRSGTTICAAILLGLHRRWAVEFSFLAGVPLMLAASAKEVYENIDAIRSGQLNGWAYGAGMAAACIVGIFALKLLITAARRAKLRYFAYYCLALATLVAVYVLLS